MIVGLRPVENMLRKRRPKTVSGASKSEDEDDATFGLSLSVGKLEEWRDLLNLNLRIFLEMGELIE